MENPQKLNVFEKNHKCLAFKFCDSCKIKYCDICKDDVHNCQKCCDFCTDYDRINYNCRECSLLICAYCAIMSNDSYEFCHLCFVKKVCKNCGYFYCICQTKLILNLPKNICYRCGKHSSFTCIFVYCTEKLCFDCYLENSICDRCDDYNGAEYCTAKTTINHRCPECYNVFTDRHLIIKKNLLTTILCLSKGVPMKLPKPIILMICERTAVFN